MYDQWYNNADHNAAVPPVPNSPAPPQMPPPRVPFHRRHRTALIAVAFALGILVAAGGLVIVVRFQPTAEIALAVNDCVAIESAIPVEHPCTDERSKYRIAAREDIEFPVVSACVKYQDTTEAVAEPAAAGEQPETVLCLAPTRFNTDDPGALQPGDCIDVRGAGDTITRVACASITRGSRVIATELHRAIPVTDQACRAHPQTRHAFAHTSLGGRAIVVCAVSTDPKSVGNAAAGDCTDRTLTGLVACDSPQADLRVLTAEPVYRRPEAPQCPDVFGANAFSMNHNDKVDLVYAICLGPADPNAALYAVVGDCVAADGTGPASRSRRVDCGDPAARYEVIDRHASGDGACPPGTAMWITWNAGVTTGATACMKDR